MVSPPTTQVKRKIDGLAIRCDKKMTTVTLAQGDDFYEVLSTQEFGNNDDDDKKEKYVDVYVAQVEPNQCGPLVKRLGKKQHSTAAATTTTPMTWADLSHLRRVRRRKHQDVNINTNQQPLELHVVLASVADVERICRQQQISTEEYFRREYNITAKTTTASSETAHDHANANVQLAVESVPARMAESEEELQEFNKSWPTIYFPNKTKEHLQQERLVTADELQQMREGIQAALHDSLGAVMVDPATGKVVSRAHDEYMIQHSSQEAHTNSNANTTTANPLSTPILLAIQGVSRQERAVACSMGMDNPAFHKGQYLCTGFDCYTVSEPTVFETMSLVHSRIRRVVFGVPLLKGVEPGGITQFAVHNLPDTNHRFRAFYCQPESALGQQCSAFLRKQDKRHQSS